MTVGYKLAQPEPPQPLLSCTAEELALHALIENANMILKEDGVEADFGLFIDDAFQDFDYKFLYNLEMDGVEDTEVGIQHGIGRLHFDEWFIPFDNAATAVHPYLID